MSRARRHGFWAALVGLAALCGCGIPVDSRATRLPPAFNSTPTTTTAGASGASGAKPPGPVKYSIYYMHTGHLVAVTRYASGLSPTALLTLLIQQPTAAESAEGITNVLNPKQPLQFANPALSANGIVNVELALPEFAGPLIGPQLAQAYGEIVFTLMDPANDAGAGTPITGVAFDLEEQPWPAFLPNSNFVKNAYVTTADYTALAPLSPRAPASPATSTTSRSSTTSPTSTSAP